MNGHNLNRLAASATLHCLTGCAIGEIAGLMIGTAAGLGNATTVAISVALAFFFGFLLSVLPLLETGVVLVAALRLVFAADTVSIAVMELVDNAVMLLIPGAMDSGLVNVVFWLGMMLALSIAFLAAYPVNRSLMARGKGHALTHAHHVGHGDGNGDGHAHGDGHGHDQGGARPSRVPGSATLAAVLTAFMVGGLVVSIADDLAGDESSVHGSAKPLATRG